MKASVKVLIVCWMSFAISGCTTTAYQKCSVPNVEKPALDVDPKQGTVEKARQCLYNYALMRDYALRLEEATSVCK